MPMSPPTHSSVPRGRRPSVGQTTERRCRSARKRPGAGFLPTWPPVARVLAGRVAPDADKHFRIYAEDDFFGADALLAGLRSDSSRGQDEIGTAATSPAHIGSAPRPEHRSPHRGRRAIRATALVGATGAVALVVMIGVIGSVKHQRRRPSARTARAGLDSAGLRGGIPSTTVIQRVRPRRFGRARRSLRGTPAALGSGRRSVEARSSSHRTTGPQAHSYVAVVEPRRDESVASETDSGPIHAVSAVSRDSTAARPRAGEFGFER
jgi:hypothetical protein